MSRPIWGTGGPRFDESASAQETDFHLHIDLSRALARLIGGRELDGWVFGDVMLDEYWTGDAARLSPEAPVPVLNVTSRHSRLGGAANVAANVAALGGRVALGGIVGLDDQGKHLLKLAQSAGIGTRGLQQSPDRPTVVKTRIMAGSQHLARLDCDTSDSLEARIVVEIMAGLALDIPDPDFVLVSDYAKGAVTEFAMRELRARAPRAMIFVDPKSACSWSASAATLITPNEREARAAAPAALRDESIERIGTDLARRTRCDVLITRGSEGLLLCPESGAPVSSPAFRVPTVDVTGAGDAALATVAFARSKGLDWPTTLLLTNAAAATSVMRSGAAAPTLTDLWQLIPNLPPEAKIVPVSGLVALRASATAQGKRIVFTNGCFDLLHPGHQHLLRRARSLGDLLIVGVNADASVRKLKGTSRPVIRERERALLIASLTFVDFVCVFEDDHPLDLVRRCRPEVLVKGGDYELSEVVGGAEVSEWGGRVEVIPFLENYSTTSLLEGIRSNPDVIRSGLRPAGAESIRS